MLNFARVLGWLFVVCNAIAALLLLASRDGGDAATRGLGRGLGAFVAILAVAATLLLLREGHFGGPTFALVIGPFGL